MFKPTLEVLEDRTMPSYLVVAPEFLAAAAADLAGIGASLSAASAAAAPPTTGIAAAAADEVSALTAAQFAAHAQMYQALSAEAAFHQVFVDALAAGSGSYAATEAANAALVGIPTQNLPLLDPLRAVPVVGATP